MDNRGNGGGLSPALLGIFSALIFVGLAALVAILLNKLGFNPLLSVFIPVAVAFAIIFLRSPKLYGILIFVSCFAMTALARYVTFKMGIVFDLSLGIFVFLLLFNTVFSRIPWKNALNNASLFTFIWLVYCLLEYFNPRVTSQVAWLAAIRWEAIYYFLIIFFTPLLINRVKDIKVFLYVWSVLTLFSILWILKQKYLGLDWAETKWLMDPQEYSTHYLYFGIRYWSIFTDAANAAVSLALSSSFFGIVGFFMEKKRDKIYFLIVAVLSLWASMFTGTRSHMVIPFIALVVMLVCSKNWKVIGIGIAVMLAAFFFFRYTNVGNSNKYIQRARSAFFYMRDPSFLLRKKNHATIKAYMADKPFGVGLGLAEWKAKKYDPDSFISSVNTDSWLYSLFVETGIVGVMIYIAIFLYFIIYGMYVSLFKLKNKFLRGTAIACTGSLAAMLVASYGNEILAQFPNGIIVFIMIGIVFVSPKIDKRMEKGDEGALPDGDVEGVNN